VEILDAGDEPGRVHAVAARDGREHPGGPAGAGPRSGRERAERPARRLSAARLTPHRLAARRRSPASRDVTSASSRETIPAGVHSSTRAGGGLPGGVTAAGRSRSIG
jgi:hypothetical protein